jgi:hypothetical protein
MAKASDWINANIRWQPIASAPFDCDLELGVIDADGEHALVFPCRHVPGGWLKCGPRQWINVRPTHWREWREAPSVIRTPVF